MVIQKLNNIIINWLTNPKRSVLSDKWRFNTSQDWKVLRDDFDSVSSETIPNATLKALGFYHSPLVYLEERTPQFVNVTDKPKLAIEPEDNGHPITDSEDEKMRKRLKCIVKKKHNAIIFVLLCNSPLLLALQLFCCQVLLCYFVFLYLLGCLVFDCSLRRCLIFLCPHCHLVLLCLLCHLILDCLLCCCLVLLCLLHCLVLLCLLHCLILLYPLCHLFLCSLCRFFLCLHWHFVPYLV